MHRHPYKGHINPTVLEQCRELLGREFFGVAVNLFKFSDILGIVGSPAH
jgi:hypothetical protein